MAASHVVLRVVAAQFTLSAPKVVKLFCSFSGGVEKRYGINCNRRCCHVGRNNRPLVRRISTSRSTRHDCDAAREEQINDAAAQLPELRQIQ